MRNFRPAFARLQKKVFHCGAQNNRKLYYLTVNCAAKIPNLCQRRSHRTWTQLQWLTNLSINRLPLKTNSWLLPSDNDNGGAFTAKPKPSMRRNASKCFLVPSVECLIISLFIPLLRSSISDWLNQVELFLPAIELPRFGCRVWRLVIISSRWQGALTTRGT